MQSRIDGYGNLVLATTFQPAALATNGTAAVATLSVTGGKGGNTTGTTGQVGGMGATATITGGAGGNAPAGSTNGNGGSITLQGGALVLGLVQPVATAMLFYKLVVATSALGRLALSQSWMCGRVLMVLTFC